jgi:adenylate cyclase
MVRTTGRYRFGPFHLDAREHRLLRDGIHVPLQLKAFEILCILVDCAGRLLTKEELLRRAWPEAVVEENNLNKNICMLRKILGETHKGRSWIETVPRVGYRFIGSVMAVESPAPPAGNHVAPPVNNNHQEKSVAVLYFENLSGNREDEYFRDGITEDVITELAKINDLWLFPRSSVLAFRDTPIPVTQVGRQLGAAFVLEGSIRRAGNRLRITARLSETGAGHSVWTERYDRRLQDIFAIQDEIAQNIARALRVVLTEKEKHKIAKLPTSNVQAYDYYLRGRQHFYQGRRTELEFARRMFAEAIEIDPGYARAYAGLADCCSFLSKWFGKNRESNLQEALAASRRAVELDPESAEAHASLGLVEFLREDFGTACGEFETALNLDAGLFEAHYFFGRACFAQGEFEKAAELFATAGRINTNDYQAAILTGLCLRALDRFAEARTAFRNGFEKVQRHVERHPDDVRAVSLGASALCGLNENALACEWADRALSMAPEEASVLYNVACSYALLEETGKALDCLEKALDQGFCHKGWLQNDPDLTSLRDHPRFQCMMQEFDSNHLSCAG